MKSFITAVALLGATASADLCAHGSTDDNGESNEVWFFGEHRRLITAQAIGTVSRLKQLPMLASEGPGHTTRSPYVH